MIVGTESLPRRKRHARCATGDDIEEFVACGYDCAEVVTNGEQPIRVYQRFYHYLRNHDYDKVFVCIRNRKVYLCKEG